MNNKEAKTNSFKIFSIAFQMAVALVSIIMMFIKPSKNIFLFLFYINLFYLFEACLMLFDSMRFKDVQGKFFKPNFFEFNLLRTLSFCLFICVFHINMEISNVIIIIFLALLLFLCLIMPFLYVNISYVFKNLIINKQVHDLSKVTNKKAYKTLGLVTFLFYTTTNTSKDIVDECLRFRQMLKPSLNKIEILSEEKIAKLRELLVTFQDTYLKECD